MLVSQRILLSLYNKKKKYKFKIIEDAAQCIDLKFKKKYLGSFGEFGCISFHESKNIHCGLGGALIINDKKFENLSHFIWERGTNRRDFNNNKVSKYTWIEIGSSFYPSELQSIVLNKQIDEIASIQKKRKKIYNYYSLFLRKLVTKNKIINMDESLISNYHMRYILLSNKFERDKLKFYLKKKI